MTWKATFYADTPATPNTVTLSGINAGDVLVALMMDDAVADNPVWPSGFSTVAQVTTTTNSMDLFAGIKKAAGGETNIDFATDSGIDRVVVAVLVFDKIDANTQQDVTRVTASTDANQASPFDQSGSITPITDGCDILALVGWDIFPGVDPGNTVTTVFSTTSGTTGAWTNRHEFNPPGVSNNGDSFYRGSFGTAVQTTAGAITVKATGTASPSANSARGLVLIALRPTPSAVVTGTATPTITEADIAAGGKTIILTLAGDTYVASSGFQTLALRGTGKSGNAINGGDVTLTFDAGGSAPQTGDYVVVFGGHGTTVTTLLPPGAAAPNDGSYTQVGIHTGTAPIFGAWIKKMGATPDTQVVGSGGGNASDAVAYGAWVISGVDLTTAQDATATTAGPTTSTNPDGASITTVTDNAWVLAMAGSVVNDATPGTISGYTNQKNSNATDTSPFTTSGMTKLVAAHGAENPGAYSAWSSGAWYAITMALRPAATTPFDDARAALISGLDSAQAEAAGWDAKVKPNIPVANVVRTSSTACTVTLQAQSDYDITAQETITATIPATMLTAAMAIVATPTFTIDQTTATFNPGWASGATKMVGSTF